MSTRFFFLLSKERFIIVYLDNFPFMYCGIRSVRFYGGIPLSLAIYETLLFSYVRDLRRDTFAIRLDYTTKLHSLFVFIFL